MTLRSVNSEGDWSEGEEVWLSKPGNSVVNLGFCIWCNQPVQSYTPLPASRPERIEPDREIIRAAHWYECTALASCRSYEVSRLEWRRRIEALVAKVGSDPRKLYLEIWGREWEEDDDHRWESPEALLAHCVEGCPASCRCKKSPPVRFRTVESSSGWAVVQMVDGKRTRVSRITRQRDAL